MLVLGILTGAVLIIAAITGQWGPGAIIMLALYALAYWTERRVGLSQYERLLATLIVLMTAVGTLFDMRGSLAGVTYDTYLHIVAGFVTMLLLLKLYGGRRHGVLIAAAITMGLGIGVEIVQFGHAQFIEKPINRADILKDVVNDAVGLLLALSSRAHARRGSGGPSRRGGRDRAAPPRRRASVSGRADV